MPDLCFIDTETTSLRPDRRAWEIAIIRRPGVGVEDQHRWLIDAADLDLGNADPQALAIGAFYTRHPQLKTDWRGDDPDRHGMIADLDDESGALQELERLTRGAVLLGSNPAFDAETLAARMRAHGICPSWHYRTVDVPTLAQGWLLGRGRPLPEAKSEEVSAACGVDPHGYERHTALGDCRWIRDLYDAVTRAPAGPPATTAPAAAASQATGP